VSGYTPSIGSEFHVLDTTSSVQGEFDSIVLPILAVGSAWDVIYTASSVSLRIVIQGDYNRDNHVDAADYVLWRRSLSQIVPHGEGADGNYDGVVNALDYNVWRANFGASFSVGASSSAVSVPESIGIVQLTIFALSAATVRFYRGSVFESRRASG